MPARSCSKWSGRSAGAGASSSRCAARSASCSPALLAIIAIAYALEALKFTPGGDLLVPHRHGLVLRRRRRVVLRAAAVAQGHRRTGRALSRRARADARFHDSQRDGSDRAAGRLVAGADSPAGRKRDRARARDPGRRAHRARVDEALRRGSPAPWPSRRSPLFTFGPGVLPSHAVGDLRHLARRRSGGAVSHRGQARQRHRGQGRRSDDQRHAVGIRRRRRGDPDSQGIRERLRARADGEGRERLVRRHAVRSRRAARLRRSRPPACAPRRTS